MRRALCWLLTVGMLAACSTPEPTPPPFKGALESPTPVPFDDQTFPARVTAGVSRSQSGWEVPNLKHGPVWYIWSPDRELVAFHLKSGLWAVSADGASEIHLVKGEAQRELVGWWQGGLVYLEHRNNEVVVGVAKPGEAKREIAALPFQRTTQNPYVGQHVVYGDYLALFPKDLPPVRVHLLSGAAQELEGGLPPTECVGAFFSADRAYALLHSSCVPDGLRVIDLKHWSMVHPEAEGYPFGVSWSPVENRWAALARPAGAGAGAGAKTAHATYVTVGDVRSQLRRLQPPEPLALKGLALWSADGQHLAVTAEVKPPTDGRGRDAISAVWIVDLSTGRWRRLATQQFVFVQGWHPSGEYLVIWKVTGGVGSLEIEKLLVASGTVEWLPPAEKIDATQPDEQLMVVSGHDAHDQATAYLKRSGNEPPLALRPGNLPYMDNLQIRPPYVSWIDFRGSFSGPVLVVKR